MLPTEGRPATDGRSAAELEKAQLAFELTLFAPPRPATAAAPRGLPRQAYHEFDGDPEDERAPLNFDAPRRLPAFAFGAGK